MDITNFMTWFVSQVVNIFSWFFNILDSLQFGGTSVLRVLITIVILIPLVGVFLTLFKNDFRFNSTSERVESSNDKDKAKVTNTTRRH